MVDQRPACEAYGFPNGLSIDITAPFRDNRLPGHAAGDLLEHIRDQYARAAEGQLSVANGGISYDVPTESLDHRIPPIPVGDWQARAHRAPRTPGRRSRGD